MTEYKTLDELCVHKIERHTDIKTGFCDQQYEQCVPCDGYDKNKDCYWSHKNMDDFLMEDKK